MRRIKPRGPVHHLPGLLLLAMMLGVAGGLVPARADYFPEHVATLNPNDYDAEALADFDSDTLKLALTGLVTRYNKLAGQYNDSRAAFRKLERQVADLNGVQARNERQAAELTEARQQIVELSAALADARRQVARLASRPAAADDAEVADAVPTADDNTADHGLPDNKRSFSTFQFATNQIPRQDMPSTRRQPNELDLALLQEKTRDHLVGGHMRGVQPVAFDKPRVELDDQGGIARIILPVSQTFTRRNVQWNITADCYFAPEHAPQINAFDFTRPQRPEARITGRITGVRYIPTDFGTDDPIPLEFAGGSRIKGIVLNLHLTLEGCSIIDPGDQAHARGTDDP